VLLLAAPLALAHELSAAAPTLYERLAGNAVLTAVVAETVDAMAANARVNQSFDKVDLKRLTHMVFDGPAPGEYEIKAWQPQASGAIATAVRHVTLSAEGGPLAAKLELKPSPAAAK
jgi:hypothetical protein